MATRDAKSTDGLSKEERAAVRQRARELKKAAKGAEALADVVAAITQMPPEDRAVAEGLHALITSVAPDLAPRTWYGFPAYAKDDKVLCFYQPAAKFGTRYGTLGFSDVAALDDGSMWSTSYAITAWDDDTAARVEALVRKAAG